jgi:hypothetical protein
MGVLVFLMTDETRGCPMTRIRLVACVIAIALSVAASALAWNIPGHMLSGAIAYQILLQESPQTVEKVKTVLEKHPWYANQWQARLQDVSGADHGLVLFMQAVVRGSSPGSDQRNRLIS